ncbi:unnamed protein product, partial [marine sediment metagenome]
WVTRALTQQRNYRKVAGEEHREWYQRLWEKEKS